MPKGQERQVALYAAALAQSQGGCGFTRFVQVSRLTCSSWQLLSCCCPESTSRALLPISWIEPTLQGLLHADLRYALTRYITVSEQLIADTFCLRGQLHCHMRCLPCRNR